MQHNSEIKRHGKYQIDGGIRNSKVYPPIIPKKEKKY